MPVPGPGWSDTTSTCTVVNRTTATTTGTVYRADAKACQYNWGTTYTDVDSCTAAESTASPYTVILGRRCQRAWSDWVTATGAAPARPPWNAEPTPTIGPTGSTPRVAAPGHPAPHRDRMPDELRYAGGRGTAVHGSDHGHHATTCSTNSTGPTAVDPTTCTAAEPSAENDYVKTTCPVTTTGPTDVASCTPADPNSQQLYQDHLLDLVPGARPPTRSPMWPSITGKPTCAIPR
jgi:hypothetical protein